MSKTTGHFLHSYAPRPNMRLGLSLCSIVWAVLGCAGIGLAQSQKFILIAPRSASAAAAGPVRKVSHAALKPRKQLPFEDLVLSSDQLFEPSKDLLTEAGAAKLNSLVPSLRQSLGLHPIVIVAHIDNLGFESYNQELTTRQAQRVKDFFVAHGVARETAIIAKGVGSAQPESRPGVKLQGNSAVRSRIIEISIDWGQEIEPEVIAAKVAPAAEPGDKHTGEQRQSTPLALPPELQENMLEPGMKQATEADLAPQSISGGDQQAAPGHIVNADEWGGGGTDFGNRIERFGGQPVDINQDGKKVVKVTPTAELQEKQRKETIEAQNEFGLWRDR